MKEQKGACGKVCNWWKELQPKWKRAILGFTIGYILPLSALSAAQLFWGIVGLVSGDFSSLTHFITDSLHVEQSIIRDFFHNSRFVLMNLIVALVGFGIGTSKGKSFEVSTQASFNELLKSVSGKLIWIFFILFILSYMGVIDLWLGNILT